MRPAHTNLLWPPSAPIATKDEARGWIGLYSDTSVDAEIQTALDAAIEKVASFVGFRISDTQVTDFFPGPVETGDRLELSEPGVDWTDAPPAVKYWSAANSPSLLTAAGSRWKRDPTAAGSVLVWCGAPYSVTDKYAYPLQVVYKSKLANVHGAPVIGRAKLAVREALVWFWTNRAQQSADAKLLDRRLSALLQATKRRG